MTKPKYHPSTLPRAWWTDPFYAEEVWRRVDTLIRAGASASAICAQTGVTKRTVHRRRDMLRSSG